MALSRLIRLLERFKGGFGGLPKNDGVFSRLPIITPFAGLLESWRGCQTKEDVLPFISSHIRTHKSQ